MLGPFQTGVVKWQPEKTRNRGRCLQSWRDACISGIIKGKRPLVLISYQLFTTKLDFNTFQILFKASALWADAFFKLKCSSVRGYTFEVPLKRFLPPLPEVGCPIFFQIWNPWGKVMEINGFTFEHFCLEVVLNRQTNKNWFYLADFALQNKVETTLPDR